MSDLKQSTKRALIWSALDKGGQQFLLFISGIVTMRLLGAEAFGIVAPLALFTGIANILTEGGLSVALIRKKDASEVDYNTMFWFNLGLGALFYVALFFSAPLIAHYNNLPELTGIARVQFLIVIFYSLGLIQSTRLIKQSDFKRLGIANVTSVFVSVVVVLVLAILGYGVWAIVMQYLAQAFTRLVLLWFLSDFKPRLMYSWRSFREMFGFSSKLIVGSLTNSISLNFYASALGKYLPTVQVGLYERANKIKETGVGFMTHIFGHSLFLMLSQLQDEPLRFLQALGKSVRTVSFVLFPALLGLAVVSPSLVLIVIGEEWMPIVPYLQILCFSGIFYVLSYLYGNALKARGRSDITLTFDILHAVLLVAFLYVTIRHGLIPALLADVACKLIVFGCYSVASARILGYRLLNQLRDISPYAGLALAMAGLAWGAQYLILNPFLLVSVQIAGSMLFYLGINKVLGSKVLDEIIQTFKKKKNA